MSQARVYVSFDIDHDRELYERLLAQALIGGQAVVVRNHLESGILQRLDQKSAHIDVIFGKQDLGHDQPIRLAPAPLHPISGRSGKHRVKV